MMFGDVSAEEGVIIHEVAVVPTKGGVLIVDVTVDAGIAIICVQIINFLLPFTIFTVFV